MGTKWKEKKRKMKKKSDNKAKSTPNNKDQIRGYNL